MKEQFPDSVLPWIDQLLIPLNNAISQFTFALQNQLTITDNFLGVIKVVQLKGNQFPYQFNHGLKVKPTILLIGQYMETSASPPISAAGVTAQWETDGPTIILRAITGLDVTKTYNFTFVILGG